MKRQGFTLLELLMVVAVMGLLGSVATAGYYAAVSGMEVRGAKESVASVIQAAQQRAATDHVPTGVLFSNKLLREGTVSHSAIAVGTAVAVRAGGRVTCVVDKYLFDEFNDINYGRKSIRRNGNNEDNAAIEAGASSMLLYKIGKSKIQSSEVKDYVVERSELTRGNPERRAMVGGSTSPTHMPSYGFQVVNANSVQWSAGDLYGYEIAAIQLPHNMIFGKKAPSSMSDPVDDSPAGADPILFKADGTLNKGKTEVTMSICRTMGADGKLSAASSFTSDKVDMNTK